MSIDPKSCTVFVQVWVDVNGLQQDTTRGCYAVSNRCDHSTGEGTANLITNVITNSNVCWSVLPIDLQYNGDFNITKIGAESGFSASPKAVPGHPNVFTGTLTSSTVKGHVNSNIQFNYNNGSKSGTYTLPVTIVPMSA